MIKNDNAILKNGDKIFQSQVVDTYLQDNNSIYILVNLTLSGVTENNPFYLYYVSPSGTIKYIYTDNIYNQQRYIPLSESSYKPFYTYGNLNAVRLFNLGGGDGYIKGDLFKFMNQFPNLTSFQLSPSQFNTDVSYSSFPNKLKYLWISDYTISGNINTLKNIEEIEDLGLWYCLFTGNFTNINFLNLKKLGLNQLNNLKGNLNTLFTNNPNLNYLILSYLNLFSGDTSTIDVSNLNYISLSLPNASVTGSITNWTFNTGLTYFYLYIQYLTGDITNWDFSNTKTNGIYLYNQYVSNNIKGDLSGWILPNTLTAFDINGLSGITKIPANFSNCNKLNYIQLIYLNGVKSMSGTTFSSSLTEISISYCSALADDINTIQFPTGLTSLNLYYNPLIRGDIGNFIMPPKLQDFYLTTSNVSGDISRLALNSKIYYLNLNYNKITGSIVNMTIPDSLLYLYLTGNKFYIDFNTGVFHTNKIQYLYLNYNSGITGNLSNLIVDNTIVALNIANTNINSDLSNLNVNKISQLYANDGGNVYGDLTNWNVSGLTYLYLSNNSHLSGSSTNWKADNIYDLRIYNTNISGTLKHMNPYIIYAEYTKISSNIATDFNFNNRAFSISLANTNIIGNLSGVTLCNSIYSFNISNNLNIIGANSFINYLFTNRKYFINSSGLYIAMFNIGDSVTGATETLGDLGTYGGNQWDLSEAEIDNLVNGLDYNGSGTNIKWNSKQKIYWIKNAQVSSVSPIKRYVFRDIIY